LEILYTDNEQPTVNKMLKTPQKMFTITTQCARSTNVISVKFEAPENGNKSK